MGSRLLEKELRGLAEMEPPEGAKERTWEKVRREIEERDEWGGAEMRGRDSREVAVARGAGVRLGGHPGDASYAKAPSSISVPVGATTTTAAPRSSATDRGRQDS